MIYSWLFMIRFLERGLVMYYVGLGLVGETGTGAMRTGTTGTEVFDEGAVGTGTGVAETGVI